MQNDLTANYPGLDIQILGVNQVGRESGNWSIPSYGNIPWLQDVDQGGAPDVWTSWGIDYRDVIILDTENVVVGTFNLTTYDLQNSTAYDDLTQMFVDAAMVPAVTGDFNENGSVDAADYTVWQDQVGQTVSPGYGADGDGDGFIGQQDYMLWKTHFGESVASGSAANAVPEPSALYLALLAVAFASIRTWRG